MSESLRQNNLAETVATTAQLDAVCDRFEAAWRSGARPSLEGFLAELPDVVSTRGFRELLEVELAYRQKSGESVSADEYLTRIPQQAAIVHQVFRDTQEHPRRLGDYELLQVIGQGAMGVVYKARHIRLNRLVAVKVLPDRLLGHKQLLARFQQEMQSIGRLSHRNIVQAFDAREESGVPILVMEFIDGISLDKLVAQGPVAPSEACELIRQAATGLQHAHEQGLVHRDIKPSNLILNRSGDVKIVDFGLARLNEDRLSMGLTNSQQALGTLDYMAPEQFDSASRADIRADIYSLGCTLFNLLAGCPPFPAPQYSSFAAKMRAHCMAAVPQVNLLRPEVPAELSHILERLMAKRPADRFATPAEVAKALEPYATSGQSGQSVIGAHDGSFTLKLSDAQASAPTNCFLPQPSTETDRPGKLPSRLIAAVPLLSHVRRKRIAIGVGVAVLVALATGLWASRNRADNRGAEKHNGADLSLAQVFGTLPGLTGDWWFDETPWLIPQVRQRWLPPLRSVGTKKGSPVEMELQDRVKKLTDLLNGSDVFEFQGQLKSLATERLPTSEELESREEITKLCSLLETSENPGADYKNLEKVHDRLLQKAQPIKDASRMPDLANVLEKLSAADCHLLAVVLQRMALNSNVSPSSDAKELAHLDAASETAHETAQEKNGDSIVSNGAQRDLLWTNCKQAYEEALKKYENDQTMQAVCLADLAQMYFEQGRYEDAVDNFRLAQTSLPSHGSPLFEAYVLCGRADANCQLSKYIAAYECLVQAKDIVEGLPEFHPMRAVVAEHTAWYYMDRNYMDAKARANAEEYFDEAIKIRQQNANNDPRASRNVYHDQHGKALLLQYRGVFEQDAKALADSRSLFKKILDDLTEQLADKSKIYKPKPDLVTAKMERDVVQRAINSMEREADGYLFGRLPEFKTAADHYLNAYEFLKKRGLDQNVEASTAVNLRFKRTMALAFAGEIEAAERALADADLLFNGLKSENEPLAFVRTVATSAVKLAKNDQSRDQVIDQFVSLFRKKVSTQDNQHQVSLLRDERLEFDVLAAEMADPDLFEKVSAAALSAK